MGPLKNRSAKATTGEGNNNLLVWKSLGGKEYTKDARSGACLVKAREKGTRLGAASQVSGLTWDKALAKSHFPEFSQGH